MSFKIKTEWDFSRIFSNDPGMAAKRKQWEKATEKFASKWKSRKDYLTEPNIMKEALDDYELWVREFGLHHDEYYYYWLKSYLYMGDSNVKANFNLVDEFRKKLDDETRFFVLDIGRISLAEQRKFLESEFLKEYKHFLERVFQRARHTLSDEAEKIMSLKSQVAYDAWESLTSTLLSKESAEVVGEDGVKAKRNFEEISGLIQSSDKKVRDEAAKELNLILKKHADVAEAELNALLADKKINDSLRNYSRPDESRHLSDDIESKVVDSLVEAVSSRLKIAHDFYELKAKLIGQEKLEYHERNVSYGSVAKDYSFEDSVNIVYDSFKKIDKQFAEYLKIYAENGQLDAFPRNGKRGGAFCVHFLKGQPTYVLLNHTGKMRDIEVIAHEMGHAIHSEFMRKQNALYFDTVLSTAEVASTFLENYVIQDLMMDVDDETKFSMIIQKLNGDVTSIIRQISCYRFEQELHGTFRQKGYVSKEEIGKLFQEHMASYMGEFVEQSEGSENWWIFWHHIRDYFYNYSYASGQLISNYFNKKMREDHSYVEKVKYFLSAGTSKSPKEIFLDLGVDITQKKFWNDGLDELERLLHEAQNVAKKLGKI